MEQMKGKEIDPEIFEASYDILCELFVNNQELDRNDWEFKIVSSN